VQALQRNEASQMGTIHQLLESKGKQAAIESGSIPRDIIEVAAHYLSEEDNALACAYSGWAQCALPHRRQAVDKAWVVSSDRMRLVVEPGRRPIGDSDNLEFVGVPFGSYARLILLYLQTQALRTNSREVELGGSWRAWMSRIGVPWGGSSGKAVREQAELISRCRLTFHFQGAGKLGLVNQSVVDGALFLEADQPGRQGRLSLETAKLSEGFFDALKKHPIPLEEAAIKALANNSAALDCYIWLAYRLHSLTAPRLVTWQALKAQHGIGFKELYHFKSKFPGVLQLALAVYPGANVEIADAGVIIKPSRPPVAPRMS
jgi:hypothetical protein